LWFTQPSFQIEEMDEKYPYLVEVKLIESIPPVDRGSRYEDPLAHSLEESGLGTVSGGGSLLAPRPFPGEQGIEYVCLDVELANLDEALAVLKKKMHELGAPVGSSIAYYTEKEVKHEEPIGDIELLYVYLDAQTLSDDIYANSDLESICKTLQERMDPIGELRKPQSWSSETLLYFAGKDADKMFSRIEKLHEEIPLLQNARITFQRRDKEKLPLELRLPLNSHSQ
jgi:hypothetical protein